MFGATVTITPPPEVEAYLGSDGKPDGSASSTESPYATVFSANVQAGPTHISVSGGGLTWPEVDIDVGSGSANTLVEIRGDAP